MSNPTVRLLPALALPALSLGAQLVAQMEKRDRELFARQAFEAQVPRLGQQVPDLCLERIDGRPWSLGQQLGKTVVLIKASFT